MAPTSKPGEVVMFPSSLITLLSLGHFSFGTRKMVQNEEIRPAPAAELNQIKVLEV